MPFQARSLILVTLLVSSGAYIAGRQSVHAAPSQTEPGAHEHDEHNAGLDAGAATTGNVGQQAGIPAGAGTVAARLASSPRHGEWARIPMSDRDTIMAWVVYPERRENAPVVIAIHENTGLTTWARGVADQLAADGFIGIAPDLLSLARGAPSTDTLPADQGRALIGRVTAEQRTAMIAAVARYGMSLPAALPRFGVVGFCWGGAASFEQAVANHSGLGGVVVYYGSAPAAERLRSIAVPVLGLYGGNDQRINAGVPVADSAMKALGKQYAFEIFDGAGHGFLRGQDGNEANARASRLAWPQTVEFFRRNLVN